MLRDSVEKHRESLRGEVEADRRGYAAAYATEALLALYDAEEYRSQPRMAARSLRTATSHALVAIALALSQPEQGEHRNGR